MALAGLAVLVVEAKAITTATKTALAAVLGLAAVAVEPAEMEPDTAVLAEPETQEPRAILAVMETTQTVAVVLAVPAAAVVAQPGNTSVVYLM